MRWQLDGGIHGSRMIPTMFDLIDLHTHSTHSDGTVDPVTLVGLAAARKIQVLALTDHDSTAGCDAAATAAKAVGMGYVPGAEVTAGWRGQEIHIVGLGLDRDNAAFRAHLSSLIALRRARIAAIGGRLQREPRFAGKDLSITVLESAEVPTRTHLAREIVAQGVAETVQDAFDKFLGRGSKGHVPQEWPSMEAAVLAIAGAGGIAVLAHPHRYKLSSGGLRNLCGEFKQAGGGALEVSLPGLSPANADRLAGLARQYALAGSVGSDFHEPGLPWRPLGRFAKLPAHVEPLLSRLNVM
jgi:3',5'-nucleoside bisphosphate phosphatase